MLEQALLRANPCTELASYQVRHGKRFRTVRCNPHGEGGRNGFRSRGVCVSGEQGLGKTPFSFELDLLVAADGVRSVSRSTLFPSVATPHDRGFSCIYMLSKGHQRRPHQGSWRAPTAAETIW